MGEKIYPKRIPVSDETHHRLRVLKAERGDGSFDETIRALLERPASDEFAVMFPDIPIGKALNIRQDEKGRCVCDIDLNISPEVFEEMKKQKEEEKKCK